MLMAFTPMEPSASQESFRVLGIDPGYGRLGLALIEKRNGKEKLIYSTCLVSSSNTPFPLRLAYLGKEVEKILKEEKPNAIGLEKLFLVKNQKTGGQVAEVRGMLLYLTAEAGLAESLFEFTPREIKTAVVGYGGASKDQVAKMVSQLIALPPKKMLDDEIDAIAVALTALAKIPFLLSTRTLGGY